MCSARDCPPRGDVIGRLGYISIMPRKKSGKKAAQDFVEQSALIWNFTHDASQKDLDPEAMNWIYDIALIKSAVAFEKLMEECLIAAVNNDTRTISKSKKINFPKHLSDEVCKYLVKGGGFFNLGGYDALVGKIKGFVPADHYLLVTVKKQRHRKKIEQLVHLRNLAAHESDVSRAKAKEAVGAQKMRSAGAWMKADGGTRMWELLEGLEGLAEDLREAAPY